MTNSSDARRHPLARLFAALALSFTATVAGAPAASAHVDLTSVSPINESVVATTPDTVVLTFNSEVDPDTLEVKLFYRDGTEFPWVARDGKKIVVDGKTVTAYPPSLDQGTYVVTYSSTGPDGHIAADQFSFSVGSPSGPVDDLRGGNPLAVDLLQTATRWAAYAAVAFVTGAAFVMLLARRGRLVRRDPAALIRFGAIAVAGAVAARFVSVAVAVAMTGGIAQVPTIVTTWKGALAWSVLALAVALIVTRQPAAVFTGAVLFAFGDTMSGHLMYTNPQEILVPLGAIHLLGVLVWLGIPAAALAALAVDRSTWYRSLGVIAFPLAVAAPLVALSGPALFFVRAGGLDEMIASLSGRYGLTIVAKTVVLGAITLVAITHLIRRGGLADPATATSPDRPNKTSDAATGAEPGDTIGETASAASAADVAAGSTAGTGATDLLTRIRRSIRTETALLAAVTLLGASLAGANPKLATGATDLLAAPTSYEQCASITGDAERFLCTTRYFDNVAKTQSVAAAIEDFSSRWRGNDTWIQSNCHQLGHRLGRTGWLTYKDIAKAFAQGSDPCDYGYMHGVIEGASAQFDEAQLKAAMTTMCEVIPGGIQEHTYRQCIHGLGHAAARRVNNDMPTAVEFCRVFYQDVTDPLNQSDPNWYRFHLCVTGISMEWNLSPKADLSSQLPIGADDTLLGECGKLDAIFQPGCIEYATTPFAGQVDKLIEIRNWCDANLAESLPCYWSIGRDAMVPWVAYDDASRVCIGGKSKTYAEECLIRMAGNIATRSLDADSIDPFCQVLPSEYLPACSLAKEAMEKLLEQMKRGYIITEGNPGPGAAGSPAAGSAPAATPAPNGRS